MQGAQERREQGRDSKPPAAFFFFFDLPSTSTAHFFPPLTFLSLSPFLPRFPTKRNSRRGGQAPEDASREACQEGRRRRGRRGYEMREKKRERGVSKNLTAPKKKLVKLTHPSFMKQKQPHRAFYHLFRPPLHSHQGQGPQGAFLSSCFFWELVSWSEKERNVCFFFPPSTTTTTCKSFFPFQLVLFSLLSFSSLLRLL